MKNRHLLYFLMYIVIDQLIKLALIGRNFPIIKDIFEIKYVEMQGTTSLLGLNSVYVSLFIVIIVAVFYYLLRIKKNQKIATPIIFILASAVANIIDKLLRGFVVDYISVPALELSGINISDVALILGIVALIVVEIKYLFKKVKKKAEAK